MCCPPMDFAAQPVGAAARTTAYKFLAPHLTYPTSCCFHSPPPYTQSHRINSVAQ